MPHVDPVPVDPVPVDPIVPDAPESPAPAVENPGTDPISDPTYPPTDPNASPAIPLPAPNSPFIIPGIYEATSDAWLTLGTFNDKNEAPFTSALIFELKSGLLLSGLQISRMNGIHAFPRSTMSSSQKRPITPMESRSRK